MLIGILGALLIFALVLSGVLAMRDPEAGLSKRVWPTLIQARPAVLEGPAAELFQELAAPLQRQGLSLFPGVILETVFEPGRLTPTAWHRMRHSVVDLVIVDSQTLRPLGLLFLKGGAKPSYLEEENRQLRESAIAEAGMPMLKIALEAERALTQVALDVLEWVRAVAQSDGNKTQVDLL